MSVAFLSAPRRFLKWLSIPLIINDLTLGRRAVTAEAARSLVSISGANFGSMVSRIFKTHLTPLIRLRFLRGLKITQVSCNQEMRAFD